MTKSNLVLAFAFSISLAVLPASAFAQLNQPNWVQQFGTTAGDAAHAIEVGQSGDLFVGGRTSGTLGAAGLGQGDFFVQRRDSAGNEIWSTQLGTSNSDTLNGMSIGSGNIFAVGHTTSSGSDGTAFDAYVSLTDFSGAVLWEKSYGSATGDVGYGAASDSNGHTLAGYTRGDIGGAHAGGTHDGFLTRFDTVGNVVWETQIGTDQEDLLFSVELDSVGNAFAVGKTNGVFAGNTSNSASDDGFLSKVDSAGNVLWTEQFDLFSATAYVAAACIRDS